MNNDIIYQIALTIVPQIGDVHAKSLINIYGDAESVFKAPRRQLEKIEGIGSVRAAGIKHFNDFKTCEEEAAFIEKYRVKALFINSDEYPQRLLNCYDSPVLLYYKGDADLNNSKVVSVVGTRNYSDYGKQVCEELLEGLKSMHVLVISGLAFGIDTIAHRAALKNDLPTVGVVAHGLDRIYPPQNNNLAKQMIENGGLLTDFKSGTAPDKQNFPKRNRIVAGICDALIVVESAGKGGSLITAELANSYNKDVFAIPGRVTDSRSEGCNYLVKSNRASLITGAGDLLDFMNWITKEKPKKVTQRELFIEMSAAEKSITGLLMQKQSCGIDEIYITSGLSCSETAQALLMLEMQGIIVSMPGKIYKMA